jgi:hypothetical protein
MFGTTFCFFSNFTYLAIQICRLSLIGKEHGRLVEKVANQMSIKRFVIYCACLSFALSIVKYFRFQINDSDLLKITNPDAFNEAFQDYEMIDEYPAKISNINNFIYLRYLKN